MLVSKKQICSVLICMALGCVTITGPVAAKANTAIQARVNGKLLTPSRCLDAWHDGTKICVSSSVDGHRLMVFDHPMHKRWVFQYDNQGLFANERAQGNGGVTYVEAYTAEALLDGEVVGSYQISNHTMGQEWSHVEGARADIRTPADFVAEGHIPRHKRYPTFDSKLALRAPNFLWKPPAAARAYQPLEPINIIKFMPSTGLHEEVHWTTALSRWLFVPSYKKTARRNINATAESFASFPIFIRHKNAEHSIDLSSKRYRFSAFSRTALAGANKVVIMAARAPIPGVSYVSAPSDKQWAADVAHLACASWEEYLLSGDPYHLRLTQFCANFAIGFENVAYRMHGSIDGKPLLVPSMVQPRALGKGLMMLWRAWALTPDAAYDWLLPKAYFAKALRDTAFQGSTYLAKDPYAQYGKVNASHRRGRTRGANGYEQQQMQGLWSVAHAAKNGFPEFEPMAAWMMAGFGDMFAVYGANYPIASIKANADSQIFKTWQDAADWVKAKNPGKPVYADERLKQWRYQAPRNQGMAAAISQLGYPQFTDYWQVFENRRIELHKCHVATGRRIDLGDECPTKVSYWGTPEDWQIDPAPVAEFARKSKLPPKAPASKTTEPTPAPHNRDRAAKGSHQSAQEASPKTTDKPTPLPLNKQATEPNTNQPKSPRTAPKSAKNTADQEEKIDGLPKSGWVRLPDAAPFIREP